MDTSTAIHFLFGLFFFVLCSGGLACNPGWTEYEGKCFQILKSERPVDIRMARRYCIIYGGDLAFINTTDRLHFIRTLPNYDGENSTYWLNENSQVEMPASSAPPPNSCPYIYTQIIQYGECDMERKFICEVENPKTDLSCPTAWYLYGSICYKIMPMRGSYNLATSLCLSLNAHLAVQDNDEKQHYLTVVALGQNKTFLVDARRENGIFKWPNGKVFQPSCGNCEHSNEDCVGLHSDKDHPTRFSQVLLNCSEPNRFICEMNATLVAPVSIQTDHPPTSTATTTTTTTLGPLQCPIGYNWKAHEESGFCYWETTYEADRLNWHQAREFCKAYGGDLASYQNLEQEVHGLGGAQGHYRGLWIGLERSQNNNFHWVDGSILNYTNWDYAQPNLASRSKFCGMHDSNYGKWALDYCGVRRWFVCKSPLVQRPTLPDLDSFFKKTPCNISSTSLYRHQWYLYKNHCYMVHEDPKYSWSMAQNFCNDNEAHLASIHSFAETDFILLIGSISSNTDYWIGLSSIGLGSSRTWSDKTSVDFLYWSDNFTTTEQNAINSCVTFDKQRGFWQSEHCNRFMGVICKRSVNSSFEFPSPQPTPLLPGNCEKGWYNLGNKCYKAFGEKWSQRIKWDEAKDKCESIGASLVSIHTKEEQDFLTDLLLNIGSGAWIGLQNLNRGTTFEWSDDTPLDYANWDVNEPVLSSDMDEEFGMSSSMQSNSCIKLSYDVHSMGKWNDVACSFKNAYICQKPKNITINETSEDLFVCRNITGWSRLGSSCYGFFDETVSWIDAQRKCKSFDADLVSFKSSALSIFLKKRLSRKHPFFWTGIREMAESKYGLLNGQRLKYSNWLHGQPQKVSTLMDNCVAMNLNADWVVRSCKENFSFVCDWNPDGDKIEDVVEKRHTCPNISEWTEIGTDTCYIFNLFHRVTWNDAMFYCFKHGGYLASIHSSKESELIRQHLLDNTAASFLHIGLGKRNDGSYGWVDHTPLDYVQWDEDEPQQGDDDCVQLFIRNGKWRNVDCDVALRGFMCSSERDTNRNAEPIEDTVEEDIVGNKLAAGGILGIIICLMVVFAIAAVTAYYVCPSTRMRVSFLDSP